MATNSKDNCLLKIGASAPDFNLPGVDGSPYTLSSFKDKKILVILFTCNHCPYVQGWEDRIIAIQKDYGPQGVQVVGINANETKNYPEDNFDQMVLRAREKKFNFVYLRDEDQKIAKAYDAACTPEVYVFNTDRKLCYHGRVDDNYKDPDAVKYPDLKNALEDLLASRPVKNPLTAALGCSIKWG